jgi:Ca-activated chloride channel family protein|tara:strand:+ start:3640 stop:4581 length:942 start_codon:yes stop_codon:yes gene_type:complete
MAIIFNNPANLWFLLSIPLLILLHFATLNVTKKKALTFANFDAIARVTGQNLFFRNITQLFIRSLIIIFIVLAISETTLIYTGRSSDFDFILNIDVSSSMSTTDFDPNRLEAAKGSAIKFIDSLNSQANIGLVTFSGTSLVESSLINQKSRIKALIKNIEPKIVGGTDLGGTITTSVNLLLPSENSKIIILLTDGRSNVGVPLQQAIDYANKNSVLIYTIGVATEEGGVIPGVEDIDAVLRLDEESLRYISSSTGGKYFRAVDQESLTNSYNQIASSSIRRISTNLSLLFMITAFILLFVEWILSNSKLRILP